MNLEIFRGLHPNFSAIPSLSEKGKPPGRAQNAPRAGLIQVVSGPTRPKRLVLRRCVRRPAAETCCGDLPWWPNEAFFSWVYLHNLGYRSYFIPFRSVSWATTVIIVEIIYIYIHTHLGWVGLSCCSFFFAMENNQPTSNKLPFFLWPTKGWPYIYIYIYVYIYIYTYIYIYYC